MSSETPPSTTSTPPLEEQEQQILLATQTELSENPDENLDIPLPPIHAPEPDEPEVNLANDPPDGEVQENGSRFSPVSNSSLPAVEINNTNNDNGVEPKSPDPQLSDLSSLSEVEEIGRHRNIPLVDLEEGEIKSRPTRQRKTTHRRTRSWSSRSRSRSPVKSRSPGRRPVGHSSRSRSRDRRLDLPRYDVRYIINKKRGHKDSHRGGHPDRRRSFSPAYKSPIRKRGRRTRTRSRSRSRSRSFSRSRSRSRSPYRSRKREKKQTKKKATTKSTIGVSSTKAKKNKTINKSSRVSLATSKKKKRRRRSSSFSISSRSPSRERTTKKVNNKVKKKVGSVTQNQTKTLQTKKVTKQNAQKPDKPRKKRKNKSDLGNVRAAVTASPVVVEKEVFAAGDKIMVSVNFKRDKKTVSTLNALDENRALNDVSNKKPACVIDIMSSPYQVFEPSPVHETIDVYTDDEENVPKSPRLVGKKKASLEIVSTNEELTEKTSEQARKEKSPVSPHSPPRQQLLTTQPLTSSSNTALIPNSSHHKGPQTPPPVFETMDFSKGPQTPSDHMDSYDPCNPTESPDIDDQQLWDEAVNNLSAKANHSNGTLTLANVSSLQASTKESSVENSHSTRGQVSSTTDNQLTVSSSSIPFINESKNDEVSGSSKKNNNVSSVSALSTSDKSNGDFPMDMDMDSPCSPQGSDLSDLFEPPSSTPVKKTPRKGKDVCL